MPNPEPASSGRWRSYALFGFTLASDFPFTTRLEVAAGAADLSFTCSAEPPFRVPWEGSEIVGRNAETTTHDGEGIAEIRHLGDCEVLRFNSVDFYLWRERIVCHAPDPGPRDLVELRFLGPVLAYWLERRGLPVLHASSVAVGGDGAVACLSANRGGKTSLAAALMGVGCALLTDDLLPVEKRDGVFVARPGYPQMRMWPDQALHFLGHFEDLELIHPDVAKRRVPIPSDGFGEFCGFSRPLISIYLLQRQPPGRVQRTEISTLSPRDVVVELVRYSFSPSMVAAIGQQERRFDLFSQLVERVPVRRLRYPSGLEYLPSVSARILCDLASTSGGLR